jgi:amidase
MTVWACHRAPVGVEMPRAVTSAAVRRADFYNVSGLPAITLPLHSSDLGLPIGMMFGAGYGEEGVSSNVEEVSTFSALFQPGSDRGGQICGG